MSAEPWLEGTTEAGVTVYIRNDPYVNRGEPIIIGGEPAEIAGGWFGIVRLRDGGTTTIQTDRGKIYWPHSLGREGIVKGTPTLDGEAIVRSVWPAEGKT